jgi:hypothetical protein
LAEKEIKSLIDASRFAINALRVEEAERSMDPVTNIAPKSNHPQVKRQSSWRKNSIFKIPIDYWVGGCLKFGMEQFDRQQTISKDWRSKTDRLNCIGAKGNKEFDDASAHEQISVTR